MAFPPVCTSLIFRQKTLRLSSACGGQLPTWPILLSQQHQRSSPHERCGKHLTRVSTLRTTTFFHCRRSHHGCNGSCRDLRPHCVIAVMQSLSLARHGGGQSYPTFAGMLRAQVSG